MEGRNAPRVIRLSPDYGTRWPVWDAEDDSTESTLQLTEGLRARISAWNSTWEKEYHYLNGWSTRETRDYWLLEGEEIARQLERELKGAAEVRRQFTVSYQAVAE